MFGIPAGGVAAGSFHPSCAASYCRMKGVVSGGQPPTLISSYLPECPLRLSTARGPPATGKKDIGITYRFGRPTYRAVTRGFPSGARPTYRGPRDQLTVDKFGPPAIYPQDRSPGGRDQLTVATGSEVSESAACNLQRYLALFFRAILHGHWGIPLPPAAV